MTLCVHYRELVQPRQQSRCVVLFSYLTTLYPATNIDGRGCALSELYLITVLSTLGFQSEIPHWEAAVSASRYCQAHPMNAQPLTHFRISEISTSGQKWISSWLSSLTSRFTVWPWSTCLPTVFQWRACQVVHIFNLPISGPCLSSRTKTVTIGPRGFYCSCPSVWNSSLHLFVTLICLWRISAKIKISSVLLVYLAIYTSHNVIKFFSEHIWENFADLPNHSECKHAKE